MWRTFRGVTASLFGAIVFFMVVGLALPGVGLAASYALTSVTALVITDGLFALNRVRAIG